MFSVLSGHTWAGLRDWPVHSAIPMSLAVLVLATGEAHAEMAMFMHVALFSFWEQFPSSGVTGARGVEDIVDLCFSRSPVRRRTGKKRNVA